MSGGINLGTVKTTQVEILHCIFIALGINLNEKLKPSDLTYKNLVKAANTIETTKELAIPIVDVSWYKSAGKIVNFLNDESLLKENHIVHYHSDFTNQLFRVANELLKDSGSNLHHQKWNSSDLWLVSDTLNVDLNSFATIEELNSFIKNSYKSKKLIGVSLKKVSNDPNLKEFNSIGHSRHVLKGYSLGNFWNSKVVSLIYDDEGEIQGRSYRNSSQYSLEIKYKNTYGGKCGHGPLCKILENYGLSLPKLSEVVKETENLSHKFIKNFYRLYTKLCTEEKITIKEFSKRVFKCSNNERGRDWIYSKYFGLKIIEILKYHDKNGNIFDEIFKYSSCRSELSSTFVKVY